MTRPEDPFANPQTLIQECLPLIPKFAQLSRQWGRDTQIYSSPGQIVEHPAYAEIVGMGPAAVPLILDSLSRQRSVRWFHALVEITGHDLEGERENYETVGKAADGWLEWGRQKGLYPLGDKLKDLYPPVAK